MLAGALIVLLIEFQFVSTVHCHSNLSVLLLKRGLASPQRLAGSAVEQARQAGCRAGMLLFLTGVHARGADLLCGTPTRTDSQMLLPGSVTSIAALPAVLSSACLCFPRALSALPAVQASHTGLTQVKCMVTCVDAVAYSEEEQADAQRGACVRVRACVGGVWVTLMHFEGLG